jgi:hypothetical protein
LAELKGQPRELAVVVGLVAKAVRDYPRWRDVARLPITRQAEQAREALGAEGLDPRVVRDIGPLALAGQLVDPTLVWLRTVTVPACCELRGDESPSSQAAGRRRLARHLGQEVSPRAKRLFKETT